MLGPRGGIKVAAEPELMDVTRDVTVVRKAEPGQEPWGTPSGKEGEAGGSKGD